jgi:hypothetical protein
VLVLAAMLGGWALRGGALTAPTPTPTPASVPPTATRVLLTAAATATPPAATSTPVTPTATRMLPTATPIPALATNTRPVSITSPTPQVTATAVITGRVVDSLGAPIEGTGVAIIQRSSSGDDLRLDVDSDREGSFEVHVPQTGNPTWNVQIVSMSCGSRVMNPQACELTGYFWVTYNVNVVVPQSRPVIFLFEKATTVIRGTAGEGNDQVRALRSDGALSFGTPSSSGDFELPASNGRWDVYAVRFNPYTEGNHVRIEIVGNQPPALVVVEPVPR